MEKSLGNLTFLDESKSRTFKNKRTFVKIALLSLLLLNHN